MFLPDGRNLAILSGEEAVAQSVRQACKMRKSEDIYNVNAGVDYFGTVFSSPPDPAAARASLAQNILASPDVVSIESLVIDISANEFSYVAQIATIYGAIELRSSK
ncbi:hypothetical protein PLUTO_00100 [Luteibacter phage vB_LflM-Pluto]|uniref:Uncharacterized protein n=1 Tax=Luteibacter phage vB_LflM-Pluto TaxID=2948611 RepID=A0A9E7MV78_9CAUD|nr:hypothetical protein PLUTO_00100 [Luteibacter phage vB_LflM-Pluto]